MLIVNHGSLLRVSLSTIILTNFLFISKIKLYCTYYLIVAIYQRYYKIWHFIRICYFKVKRFVFTFLKNIMENNQKNGEAYETAIIGYPRIGEKRELKYLTEGYLSSVKGALNPEATEEFLNDVSTLRKDRLEKQNNSGLDYLNVGDFSLYDKMLDMVQLLWIVPEKYKNLDLNLTDTYFAMARGFQGNGKDVKALSMKKWFNTNYHYMVPEITKDITFDKNNLNFETLDTQILEAVAQSANNIKVSLIWPLTFLKLSKFFGSSELQDSVPSIIESYQGIIKHIVDKCNPAYIQIEEPSLVTDLSSEEKKIFKNMYDLIIQKQDNILLQTYFGAPDEDLVEAMYDTNAKAIGLDFIDGKDANLKTIEKLKFPEDKKLFAGVINGRNIWRNDYQKSIDVVDQLWHFTNDIVLNTSSSLLHVPYTTKWEEKMAEKYKKHLAFADQKIEELSDIKRVLQNNDTDGVLIRNRELIQEKKGSPELSKISKEIEKLIEEDFTREVSYAEREKIQKDELGLPILPTTTIWSFPQTKEVRKLRLQFKKWEISQEEYTKEIQQKTKEVVKLQEDIGLDVLVHGEYERNDMVEYFGENLDGIIFSENGWVQSYGTRGVKPPIIFGDVTRKKPMTVEWSAFAQSLTKKPMKGMLTGPVTILNWSFPREDIPLRDIAYQIALSIRDEVLDLEKAGIKIIQIDEAALREKLPLRRQDWEEYLDWAINSFRLVHSKVKPETQIHTHMCYSEFKHIMPSIKKMDADVITIETSRSGDDASIW